MGRKKKVEKFRVREFINASGTRSWRISGTKSSGERVRENFSVQSEAFDRRAELETENPSVASKETLRKTILSPEQLSDAEAAFLNHPGGSIASIVAKHLQFQHRAIAKGATLDEAFRFFESHYRPEHVEISILVARDQFLSSRKRLRPATLVHYEYSTAHLLKPDPNKPVHKFTVTDIEKILGNFSNPNTVRTYRRGIATFFAWALRHHFCLENPCARLDKPPQDLTKISILELKEAKRLLTASMQYADGAMASCTAISLFAGLRPSEIEELEPGDVFPDRIRVRGGKRRQLKRSVPISENLKAWLKKFPFKGRPIGWTRKMRNLKTATKAHHWVKDILRHTSISFQVERDQNEALTAFNNGTSARMMDQHYRDVIDDPPAVVEFWKLTPAKVQAAKIIVQLPSRKIVNWPSDKELAKLVSKMPMVKVAAKIGVSDVAVKKRCVLRKIILLPKLRMAA